MPADVPTLGETLDAGYAPRLRDALLAYRGNDLTLDASQVQRPSTLCLQVLISAAKTWAADGKAFCIIDPSPQLFAAARTVGLASLLEQVS